jgi:hypothetical protein
VLQECYKSATRVLPLMTWPSGRVPWPVCYKSISRVSQICQQECYKSDTRVLHNCYKNVTRTLQNRHRSSTRVLQECNKCATRALRECYKSATRVLCDLFAVPIPLLRIHRNLSEVPVMLQWCYNGVTAVCQQCASSVTIV